MGEQYGHGGVGPFDEERRDATSRPRVEPEMTGGVEERGSWRLEEKRANHVPHVSVGNRNRQWPCLFGEDEVVEVLLSDRDSGCSCGRALFENEDEKYIFYVWSR